MNGSRGSIRQRNDDQYDSEVFETVDGVKVQECLTSISSLLTSTVKLSNLLQGANFNRGCANYLNNTCILAPTSPFVFDNDVSARLLFFGEGKQLHAFWSVGTSFENCEVKMRETMKFDNYQDQNQPPDGQRNMKPLQWTFLHLKNKSNTGTKFQKHNNQYKA